MRAARTGDALALVLAWSVAVGAGARARGATISHARATRSRSRAPTTPPSTRSARRPRSPRRARRAGAGRLPAVRDRQPRVPAADRQLRRRRRRCAHGRLTRGHDTVVDAAGSPCGDLPDAGPGRLRAAAAGAVVTGAAATSGPPASGVAWTPWDWGRSTLRLPRRARGRRGGGDRRRHRRARRGAGREAGVLRASSRPSEQVEVGEESVRPSASSWTRRARSTTRGCAPAIDVATAESGLAAAQLTLARARAGARPRARALAVALGEDGWRDWRLVPRTSGGVRAAARRRGARGAPPNRARRARRFASAPSCASWSSRARGYAELGAVAARAVPAAADPRRRSDLGRARSAALTRNLIFTVALGFPLGGMSPFLVHGQVREAEGNLLATRARGARHARRHPPGDRDARAPAGRRPGEELAGRARPGRRRHRPARAGRRPLRHRRRHHHRAARRAADYVNARFQLVQAGSTWPARARAAPARARARTTEPAKRAAVSLKSRIAEPPVGTEAESMQNGQRRRVVVPRARFDRRQSPRLEPFPHRRGGQRGANAAATPAGNHDERQRRGAEPGAPDRLALVPGRRRHHAPVAGEMVAASDVACSTSTPCVSNSPLVLCGVCQQPRQPRPVARRDRPQPERVNAARRSDLCWR